MKLPEVKFKSVHERKLQGRKITSTAQRDYLEARKPALAQNLMHKTSPTEFIPARSQRRKKK